MKPTRAALNRDILACQSILFNEKKWEYSNSRKS
jgi:hypothetical protein